MAAPKQVAIEITCQKNKGINLGDWGNVLDADDKAQGIADSVRADLEAKSKQKFSMYKAVWVRTQTVGGTNWLVKVQVTTDSYVHLLAFQSAEGKVELRQYQANKVKNDALVNL